MAKKRANGEGSIRKRKDGRWEGFYTAAYDPETGKQKLKNVLGKTQAEVKEKLKKAIADSQRLDMNRSGTHTVRSWVKMWYEVYAEPRLREKTKDYYLNYIDKHIIPELGDIKLDKLTTIQIQKFYNDLQKNGRVQRYKHIELKNKGLSVRVVHGIHTLLNNCLEQAVAERLILVNPARGCKLPKMEKWEMKVLPEDKIKPYLMEAEKRGLLAPFYLELTTGLRRGELLALLWTDLDVENRTISITKQVNRIKGELVVSLPKTQNSVRVLPVSQQAVDLLVEELEKHPGNPYMFPSPKTGGMFDPDSFRHTHEKILKTILRRIHEGLIDCQFRNTVLLPYLVDAPDHFLPNLHICRLRVDFLHRGDSGIRRVCVNLHAVTPVNIEPHLLTDVPKPHIIVPRNVIGRHSDLLSIHIDFLPHRFCYDSRGGFAHQSRADNHARHHGRDDSLIMLHVDAPFRFVTQNNTMYVVRSPGNISRAQKVGYT